MASPPLPKQQRQSQASLEEQLRELQTWANRLGLYDAADAVQNLLNPASLRGTISKDDALAAWGIKPNHLPDRSSSGCRGGNCTFATGTGKCTKCGYRIIGDEH